MLIVVQFPIADLRPFINDDKRVPVAAEFSELDLANTSDYGGEAQSPFLRSVGPLRKRRQGVGHIGDSLYFKGRSAMLFESSLSSIKNEIEKINIPTSIFFRRFQSYYSEHKLACYEIGILLDLRELPALNAAGMKAVLNECLSLPVRMRGDDKTSPLIKAGPRIAAHVLRNTTYRKQSTAPDWTMCARKPTVLIEYGTKELTEPLPEAITVDIKEAPGIKLEAARVSFERVPMMAWLLSTGIDRVNKLSELSDRLNARYRNKSRQLRINLLRHHAEREVLAYTLYCTRKPDRLRLDLPNLDSSRLKTYLVHATSRLSRQERFGFDQGGISDAIMATECNNYGAQAVDAVDIDRYIEIVHNMKCVFGNHLFNDVLNLLCKIPMGLLEDNSKFEAFLLDKKKKPLHVAVSYSHADAGWMKSFTSHMEEAERFGLIKSWDDRWIRCGTDYQKEIDHRFLKADVVVFLVSKNFLNSCYCMKKEIPLVVERADRKEAVIIPVILHQCEWQNTILGRYEAAPPGSPNIRPVYKWRNRAEAWRHVIHSILVGAQALDS